MTTLRDLKKELLSSESGEKHIEARRRYNSLVHRVALAGGDMDANIQALFERRFPTVRRVRVTIGDERKVLTDYHTVAEVKKEFGVTETLKFNGKDVQDDARLEQLTLRNTMEFTYQPIASPTPAAELKPLQSFLTEKTDKETFDQAIEKIEKLDGSETEQEVQNLLEENERKAVALALAKYVIDLEKSSTPSPSTPSRPIVIGPISAIDMGVRYIYNKLKFAPKKVVEGGGGDDDDVDEDELVRQITDFLEDKTKFLNDEYTSLMQPANAIKFPKTTLDKLQSLMKETNFKHHEAVTSIYERAFTDIDDLECENIQKDELKNSEIVAALQCQYRVGDNDCEWEGEKCESTGQTFEELSASPSSPSKKKKAAEDVAEQQLSENAEALKKELQDKTTCEDWFSKIKEQSSTTILNEEDEEAVKQLALSAFKEGKPCYGKKHNKRRKAIRKYFESSLNITIPIDQQ